LKPHNYSKTRGIYLTHLRLKTTNSRSVNNNADTKLGQ